MAPRLPIAALVIGSLSPDFEYLLRLAPGSFISHTSVGLFAFCLPASMLAWLGFCFLVRPALMRLLPSGLRAELQTGRARPNWQTYAWAIVAMLLGALTHLAWDACTHANGWAVAAFPALRTRVGLAVAPGLRWTQLLQHGSTVIGLGALALWASLAWKRFPPEARRFTPAEAAHAWRVSLALYSASAAGAALNGMRMWGKGARHVMGYAAVGAMVGLVVATLGYGAFVRWTNRRSIA